MSLKYNAVQCLVCGNIIESTHRHDYKVCGCPNHAMVDGGLDYGRYGAVDINKIKLLHIYEEDITTEEDTSEEDRRRKQFAEAFWEGHNFYLSTDDEDEGDSSEEQAGEDRGDEPVSDDME